MPSFENIYTDSADAENLKYKVCSMIREAAIRIAQIPIIARLLVTIVNCPVILMKDLFPVHIGFCFQVRFIFIPALKCIIEKAIIKKIKLPIDYLECFGIYTHLLSFCTHSISTPSSIFRFVACRALLEFFFISNRRKIINNSLVIY